MIKKLVTIMVLLILALILGVVSCAPKAEPLTPADFYKGKTIDFVISHSTGGLYDLTARIVATHLGNDTKASVIVTNREGASGLEGINYVYRSKPDGLTMGMIASTKLVPNKVLNEPAAVYEIEKFSYIMSIDHQLQYFFVSPEGPYQSITDLQAGKNLKIGGSSPSGPVSLCGLTVIKLIGLDAKVITGFAAEPDRALAVKRGELIGYVIGVPTARPSMEAGMIRPMFVVATERDSLMPDVPAITELVNLSGEDLELVKFWDTALAGSNLLIASPGIPEDRLEFLRDLAKKWVQDEAFCKEIDAVSGGEVPYVTGEEITRAMQDGAAALTKFQAIFAELIEKYRA